MDEKLSAVVTREPNLRAIQQLMGLVEDYPLPEHEALWQSITPESVSEPELRMAMDRALHLYLKWLRDDLHSVFRLLAVQSRVSNNSLERARTTANTLSKIAEDAHWIKAQQKPNKLELVKQLVDARWDLRWAVSAMDRSVW